MAEVYDIKVPGGWSELTEKQMAHLYHCLSSAPDITAAKVHCLLQWGCIDVVGRDGSLFLLKLPGRRFARLSAKAVAALLTELDWMEDLPVIPRRPERFGRRKALAADFEGVEFGVWLAADNVYNGWLYTHDDAMLDQLGSILYPGPQTKLKPWQRTAIFYWFAALKSWMQRRFPDFFVGSGEGDGHLALPDMTVRVREAMDAQIRALTKGDPTKEAQIYALDTWRALTELNAQAREYSEMRKKYKTK